ncbi:MAG: disulfide oxidoreductase [Chloroflexota bacterium]
MTVVAVATFLALLGAIAVVVDLILIAGTLLVGREARTALRDLVSPYALPLAALVALTAMSGSLYFSEVAHLEPCTLCWYQRIAMYPLVLLLGIAAVRRDGGIRPYAMSLAAVGVALSAYHVAVQRLPGLPSTSCSATAPCSAVQVEVLGFVTIPVLALVAFTTIFVLLALRDRGRIQEDPTP